MRLMYSDLGVLDPEKSKVVADGGEPIPNFLRSFNKGSLLTRN